MSISMTNKAKKVLVLRWLLAISFLCLTTTSYASGESPKMSKVNVFIIHGFMATPQDHWFQWLKNELEAHGMVVKVLSLPDSSSPNPTNWHNAMSENIDKLNGNTFIVTHSLGTVSLLTYLEDRMSDNSMIGGLAIVSGFVSPLPELPQLNSFVSNQINFKKIIHMVPKRVVFGSPQDPIVPYALTKQLAKELESEIYPIENAGHFLASDGFETFPKLLKVLLSMIGEND
ncbi:RBBP9/YdeN family alpha/beta hydrolase [Shewanella algae]|uniref:RBBP9/YdeN family alpha/beta hydrolase n=1 Tax=Shewanella algae TaxID=38313 RepID=UPI0031F5628D